MFSYFVEAYIDRFHSEDENSCKKETHTCVFTHKNPFKARKLAFRMVHSFIDTFDEANNMGTDGLFKIKDGWYAEYNVVVIFKAKGLKKGLEIHNSISSHLNQTLLMGENTYDPVSLRAIVRNLKKECEFLRVKGVSLKSAKKIEITFSPGEEILKGMIFPTDWIKGGERIVQNIKL